MRLFADELGRFDYLLHILKNLLRFVKYFQKKFSLGIYAPTENPQTFEKPGNLGDITLYFRLSCKTLRVACFSKGVGYAQSNDFGL